MLKGYGTYRYIYADSDSSEMRTVGQWHSITIAMRNMSLVSLIIIVGMEPRKRLSILLRFTLTDKVGD